MMLKKNPPKTVEELLYRAKLIAGKTLGELAFLAQYNIPNTLLKAKGWVGKLIETHLGADSGNQSQPDFFDLGVELKTIPLKANGSPSESTYVCTAPVSFSSLQETWSNSRLRKKISTVLWFPYEGDSNIALTKRRLGMPLLWHLDIESEKILQRDWEELMEMLLMGKISQLSAHYGTYLQLRPKAAHSRIHQNMIDLQGEIISSCPKGFYLRTIFTQKILSHYYS